MIMFIGILRITIKFYVLQMIHEKAVPFGAVFLLWFLYKLYNLYLSYKNIEVILDTKG